MRAHSFSFFLFMGILSGTGLAWGSAPHLVLGAQSIGYLNPRSSTSEVNSYYFLNARGRYEGEGSVMAGAAEGEVIIGLNEPELRTLVLPEAYIGTSPELSSLRVSVGRRLETWSRADDEWGLGIWQPRFRWDYLNPEPQGLTGTWLEFERTYFRFIGFWSPVYFPDQGPPVRNENGALTSASPWFQMPSQEIELLDEPTALRYTIDRPSIREVVLRPSAGALFRFGAQKGIYGHAAYAYKPANQILMAYSGFLDVTDLVVDVTLHPRIVNHHVGSLEAGFEGERVSVWANLMLENPVIEDAQEDWTTQMFLPAKVGAVGAEAKLWRWSDAGWALTRVSALRVIGGNASDFGPYAARNQSVFEPHYLFSSIVSLSVDTPLPGAAGKWFALRARFMHELTVNGNLLSLMATAKPGRGWRVFAGADVLGVGEPSAHSDDFFTRYRGQDRVLGGVSLDI